MSSHAHVILELPAPKEVSMIWDLNLSASFSSQDVHVAPGVANVSRPLIRRLIDVVPVLFCLHRLAAPLYRYIALARRGAQSSDPNAQGYSMVLDDTRERED
jgi:hypothetical protein